MIVKYVNSINQEINFIARNLLPTSGYLHKRKWIVNGDDVEKDSMTYNLTLTLRGSLEIRKEQLDKICDIFEYDLLHNKKGKLYFGDYYLSCYIVSSETQVNANLNSRTDINIEIYSSNQDWILEHEFNFKKIVVEYDNPTFSMSFPIKFGNTPGTSSLNIDVLSDSKFNMIVYGPVNDPSIEIGGNLYNVHVELDENEYLISDYENRTIEVVSVNGYRRDVFNKRNKDNDFFKKIKNGYNTVSWSGNFGFDIIVFEERSEPKWI